MERIGGRARWRRRLSARGLLRRGLRELLMAEGTGDLGQVAAEASTCTRCRLHSGRTQVVFGQGSPTADLMFVREAPGFHEDRKGYPFVGPTCQLLNRLLSEFDIRREDVYICNVIKCRPP